MKKDIIKNNNQIINSIKSKYRKYSTRQIIFAGVAVLCILAASLAIYFYIQYKSVKNSPSDLAKQEAQKLVQKISQFVELPKDEMPTIATITDKTKLNRQSFFKNAENGDKVIIYTVSGEAILYRPSVNKIITAAPINLQAAQTATSQAIPAPIKITVYNGGSKVGLAEGMKTKLSKILTNISVTTGNAEKHDYPKTLVIKIKNISDASFTQIVKAAGGEIAAFPDGEIKPDADVLIIVNGQ